MKISLLDIEVRDLNNVSIMLISKFARALHEHDGTVLKLNDPNVLLQVAKYVNTTDSPQLRILYQRLKLELRNQLSPASPNRADVGVLVVNDDLKSRVKKRMQERQMEQVYQDDAASVPESGYSNNLDSILLK